MVTSRSNAISHCWHHTLLHCLVFKRHFCCNAVHAWKCESAITNQLMPLQIQYCYCEHACVHASATTKHTVALMNMRVTVIVLQLFDGGCRTRALGVSWSQRWEAQPPLHTPSSLAHTQIASPWVRTPPAVLYVVLRLWPPTPQTSALLSEQGDVQCSSEIESIAVAVIGPLLPPGCLAKGQ